MDLQYRRDQWQKDMTGKRHNKSGSLDDYIFMMQSAEQKDSKRLDPFLDFEERHQKVFLRRGLKIYCELIFEELDARRNENQEELAL